MPDGYPAGGGGLPPVPTAELVAVGPYPDALLDELPGSDPHSRYELRETVALAFVAALQLLPPRQRSVLLLRDVLGWSAREIADALETSVAAVNSALQRARATLKQRLPPPGEAGVVPEEVERAVVRRFLAAWEAADLEALAAVLTEDVLLTMPPMPLWYQGREGVTRFFGTVPAGGRIDRIRLVPTRVNRLPAAAAYMPDPDGTHRAYGMMVLRLRGDAIAEITGFADPALFPSLGLPQAVGGTGGSAPSSVQAGGS